MRIASWNVNSIRARMDHLEQWLRSAQPDVLCLQETKVVDNEFPTDALARLGYETVHIGQKTYNGVAVLSRHTISDVSYGLVGAKKGDDARLIGATVQGVRILSAYIPNGKNLDSPSYPEKLEWLAQLRRTLDASVTPDQAVVLAGDFNVARDDRDVSDPEAMRNKIHFSAPEHKAIDKVLEFGLKDTFRLKHDAGEHYTWWDYRMGAFRRNRGLRIDYIFATECVTKRMTRASIDKEPRSWEKPSDHAPVLIEFDQP